MKNIGMILVCIMMSACSVVGPGQRGVRVSLGTVSEQPKEPGAYLWLPFLVGMAKIDVQIQKSEVESSASSKDMQEIKAHVAVNWSLNASDVVNTYKTIGTEDDVLNRIISPAVNEVMKAAASKRGAEEILAKRMELKADIDNGLLQRLKQYGITLHDVSIVNLTFSPEFSKAVEDKQIAEQQAKQAEYVTQKATQEAHAEVERAKGQAEAQRLMKSTITKEILQQRAIEKWNGQFPQYMGGNGALPFINIKAPRDND